MSRVALDPHQPTAPTPASGTLHRWLARRLRTGTGRVPVDGVPDTAIRPRRPQDVASCGRLLRPDSLDGRLMGRRPGTTGTWLDGPDVVDAWVAERRGEIIGQVAVSRVAVDAPSTLRWREITGREPDELLAVTRLLVRPRFRGRGIGSTLVSVALADIRARGCLPVLEVVTTEQLAPGWARAHDWTLRASDVVPGSTPTLWVHRHEAVPTH
jgi:GNAT superfamily N-acetyltransferase